ncbi:MAG: hypothetical protein HQL05_15655 [Nitrospirae bacterium]|nr:hypothetical protein [Nitrospirota bacterium]
MKEPLVKDIKEKIDGINGYEVIVSRLTEVWQEIQTHKNFSLDWLLVINRECHRIKNAIETEKNMLCVFFKDRIALAEDKDEQTSDLLIKVEFAITQAEQCISAVANICQEV